MLSVMILVASTVLAAGVNVAVHVTPPSDELTALIVPFGIIRSALLKPVTASENVIVTSDVSLAVSDVSATTMAAVGRTISIA
ncbi:hypothetical protein D3C76_1637040 [compost metagenome]